MSPIPPFLRRWRSEMVFFGEDFTAARSGSLYTARSGQHPLLVIACAALLFLFYSFMQIFCGLIAHVLIFGTLPGPGSSLPDDQASFLKAVVVGILPASLMTIGLAWFLASLWNPTQERGLPLHMPRLGWGGWLVTVFGFVVAMYAVFILVFVATGLDPKAYLPSSEGLNDTSSSAGMIEKTIADLADEPLIFALAFPGVAFGAPLVEEFVFRGALFASLRGTWLRTAGMLIVTSAVWAVVHGATAPWLFVVLLFFMGLVLGGALLRFGSLWVPVILHCTWNGIVSLGLLTGITTQ